MATVSGSPYLHGGVAARVDNLPSSKSLDGHVDLPEEEEETRSIPTSFPARANADRGKYLACPRPAPPKPTSASSTGRLLARAGHFIETQRSCDQSDPIRPAKGCRRSHEKDRESAAKTKHGQRVTTVSVTLLPATHLQGLLLAPMHPCKNQASKRSAGIRPITFSPPPRRTLPLQNAPSTGRAYHGRRTLSSSHRERPGRRQARRSAEPRRCNHFTCFVDRCEIPPFHETCPKQMQTGGCHSMCTRNLYLEAHAPFSSPKNLRCTCVISIWSRGVEV